MATRMKRETRTKESTENQSLLITCRVSKSTKSIRNILVCPCLFLMPIAIGDCIDGRRTDDWLFRLLMAEEECRLSATGASTDRL